MRPVEAFDVHWHAGFLFGKHQHGSHRQRTESHAREHCGARRELANFRQKTTGITKTRIVMAVALRCRLGDATAIPIPDLTVSAPCGRRGSHGSMLPLLKGVADLSQDCAA